ncbi:MAG TPA: ATP-binding protein, partial [Isosphaeraceae bacterium]|nr:ATP-binding protein [Isosphaeraceae bacterium]
KIGRDISQQRRMEDERREAERRKDEFLAMLAHELRNPLASISNATQLFGTVETVQDLEWAKEVILRQIQHLSRLIDDLLDVSRITRGKIQLQEEEIALAPVVRSAIEVVRPILQERKHEWTVSLEPNLWLRADPLRLEQILVNLLSNAVKYTDAGGRIEVSATSEGEALVIKVRDNGIGIPARLIPHVFDLFVQGDRSAARTEGGLGIGLTLVQKLTQMHAGSVSVASEGPGKGTEFTVRLPALKPTTEIGARSKPTLPKVERGSARVMVVDDMPDTAHALTKILKLLGHDVTVAYDGPSAIEVARAHRPEVILLDIGLPGMDGYELARRLRQEECCREAVMIAASGYGQEEDRRRSKEA